MQKTKRVEAVREGSKGDRKEECRWKKTTETERRGGGQRYESRERGMRAIKAAVESALHFDMAI